MDKATTSSSSDPKYRGVRKRKWGKWVSEIRLPNSRERIWLGSYDSPEKAARAFDAALFCLRGPNADFNFPNCPPDIPGAISLAPSEIQAVAAKFANESPPDEENVSAIDDWSFLKVLDSKEGESEFGLYSELHYDSMGSELYPPQPQVVPMDDDDDDDNIINNGDENDVHSEPYSHHSFLWNF